MVVGETRPLRNVLGEALEGRFSFELEIISFLSRVMSVSKSFFVSRALERIGAKRSSSWALGFDDVFEVF